VKKQISDFQQLNSRAYPCKGANQQNCSYVISGLVAVEKEDKLFGALKNQYDTCAKWIAGDKNSKVFKSPKDLSQNLAQYQFNGTIAADSYVIDRCISADNVRSKEAVSKYYYYVGRMSASQASDIEEIADLDRILNEGPVLAGTACDAIPFDKNRARCQELQKTCRPTGGIDEVVKQAQEDLKEIDDLKKDISKLSQNLNVRQLGSAEVKRRNDLIQANEFKIEMIKGRSPVLKGETFSKEQNRNFKEAVHHQLQENRKILSNHLIEVSQKHMCMTGTVVTRSCSSEKVRDFVENETQRLPEFFDVDKGKNRDEAVMGGNYMNFQQCLHDTKVGQLKDDEMISGAFINAGLGLATLGLGTVFTAAKAVQSVRQMQLAAAAKALITAGNAGNLGKALIDAGTACLSDEKVLKGQQRAAGSACNAKSSFSSRVAVKAHDDCVMKLAMAALAGVPVGVGAVQKAAQTSQLSKTEQVLLKNGVTKEDIEIEKAALKRGELGQARKNFVSSNAALDNPSRFQKIKENFPNLGKDKIDCVVGLVHPIGPGKGVYNYDKMDIWQKGRTLRRFCQIGVSDTRALLELGYAGELPKDAATAEFLKMLGKSVADRDSGAIPSIDGLKAEAAELEKQLANTTDPLKRVQLRDEIESMQQKMVQESLEQNPKPMDQFLSGEKGAMRSISSSKAQIGDENRIPLSADKIKQLEKAANGDPTGKVKFESMLIDIKPGDNVLFDSPVAGKGIAKILRPDPDQPGNIFVEIAGKDGQKARTVSMPQTEIAMTDAETWAALMSSAIKNTGPKELTKKELAEIWGNQLMRDVSKSKTKIEADNLLEKLRLLENEYMHRKAGLMTDPAYVETVNKYKQLTGLSREEDQKMRALYEINVNKPKASAEDLKLINEAKAIRDSKSETDLPKETRKYFEQIKTVEEQLKAAPAKFRENQTLLLRKMNGSDAFGRRPDYPSQTSFLQSFTPQKATLSLSDKQDYKSMEKLFSEDPRSLSDESAEWIRLHGAVFYQNQIKSNIPSDATRDYFLKRLKIYLDVYNNR
jgi:hypothetical protein